MMFLRIINSVKKNFSLDSRSLALFRVCAAFILIIDFLFTRLPYFTLFYTEKGILPLKSLLVGDSFWASSSSLNFISSSYGYQIALFILAIVFFLMLFIGYKTKWAVLGSWILLASFQSRNFLIFNSGDTLLLLMLFWTLYLPLGRHFSVDSSLQEQQQKPFSVFSVNSFSFIFQILFVYYFSYLLKTDDIWKTGQGVYYALMLDNFRTVWGDILLQYPYVMKILSYITYYIVENLVLFLFVFLGVWWRFRLVLILSMCLFHLSLGFFLHLGLFPWICMAGWIAFLPAEFWEKMGRRLPGKKNNLLVYYDGSCLFCKKAILLIKTFLILPHVSFFEAQSDKQALSEMEKRNSWLVFDDKEGWQGRWPAWIILVSHSPLFFYLSPLLKTKIISNFGDWFYQKVAGNRQKLGHLLPDLQVKKKLRQGKALSILLSGFFFFCFIYSVVWNVRATNFIYYSKYMPQKWNGFGSFFHLHQYWNMFSPKPLDITGWIILSAVKLNGADKIDLWRQGQPLSMEKPYRYDMSFSCFRIRKMMENLVLEHKNYSRYYLTYLCDKWNKKTDEQLIKNIRFIYMKQIVPPIGEELPEPEKILIRRKTCKKPQSG